MAENILPEELTKILDEQGVRKTPQRLAILALLLKSKTPLSAEEIDQKLEQKSNLDLATIYRNLNSLTKIGLLEKTYLSDKKARFVLKKPHQHSHLHHIECKKCHKIETLDMCLVSPQVKYLEKSGFRDITHRLEFFAICPKCAS